MTITNLGSWHNLTITDDAVDASTPLMSGDAVMLAIDTEGSAASDHLIRIDGGEFNNFLVIRCANASRPVIVKDSAEGGNIDLGGGDITLNDINRPLLLEYDGYGWSNVLQCTSFLGEPNHDGTEPGCPTPHAVNGHPTGTSPVSLRTGEKTEKVTDLSLNTPAGTLDFTRSYRQSKLSEFLGWDGTNKVDVMGAGWLFNHAIWVDDSVTDKLLMWLEGGTQVHFTRVGVTDIFAGDPGSTASIDAGGSGDSTYVMTAQDGTKFIFDEDKRIRTRQWANGEEWTYSYYESPHFAAGLLEEVSDDYGRKLQFAYINDSGEFNHRQLLRVGDHSVVDIEDPEPTDRYVEFTYSDSAATPDRPLLTGVRDVRGEDWTYEYNPSAGSQENWLVRFTSPAVDVDGDGSDDGSIIIKELTYTLDGSVITDIQQRLGKFSTDPFLKTTDYEFQPNGRNITTETTAGKTTTHYFAGGVYAGPANAAGDLTLQGLNANYRPNTQQDANGNTTSLVWSADGKHLNAVTDVLGQTTEFAYDSLDRLMFSTDTEQRRTLYLYEAGELRQPTHVLGTDESASASSLITNGDMELNSDWSDIGSPTTNERSNAVVDSGTYARYVDGSSGTGIQSTAWDIVANRPYIVCARVYAASGTVKMGVSGTANFDATTGDNDVWETLVSIYTPTSADSDVRLEFTAQGGAAEFYVDNVFVLGGDRILRWQEFTYDAKGRTLTEKQVNPVSGEATQQVTRTYYTSGDGEGLLETVEQADIGGSQDVTTTYFYDTAGRVKQTNQSSNFGNCEKQFTLYDAAGNVLAGICNYDPGMSPEPEDVSDAIALFDPAVPDKNMVTVYEYDALGRQVKTRAVYTPDGTTVLERVSLTLYDALSRVVRTIGNYVAQGSSAPGEWVWDAGAEQWEDGANNTISFGAENNQNIISDTRYNARGLVRFRQDVLGNVTLYGYDDADRLVKLVQNAADSDYNNDYSGMAADPDLSEYEADNAVDQDIILTQVYDAAGNLVKTVDARGIASFVVYDALNRPVKVVQNAKTTATIDLNPGDVDYEVENDPRSAEYVISLDPDRDFISLTEYDALGRVMRTRRLLENRDTLEQWDVMLYGYDSLGRQVRTIQHVGTPEYNIAADPDLSGYSISSATDEDIVTDTEYDAAGRVLNTTDVNGSVTRPVYDGLGRQYRTIVNYVAQENVATDEVDPSGWRWENDQWEFLYNATGPVWNAVDFGANNDQNIISDTTFDEDGRVDFNRSVEGLVDKTGYDESGRQVISVQNFVDDSYELLKEWVFESGVWKDEASGTAIARGAGFDQNIIGGTEYDSQNRVLQTRDVRGNLTRHVYDSVGRRIRTVMNYVPQEDINTDEVDPSGWRWDNGQWEFLYDTSPETWNAVDFGSDNDQNRISQTAYDVAGRVVSTRDAAGNEMRTVYDKAGRRTLSVSNYAAQENVATDEVDPAAWQWYSDRWEFLYNTTGPVWSPVAFGAKFDTNHISQSSYNKAGQVLSTRDARGTETTFTYDTAGRRTGMTAAAGSGLDTSSYTCYDKAGRVLRVIENYVPLYTEDEEPELISPDAWLDGEWGFNPLEHGSHNDTNLISEMTYDGASRQIASTNPAGDTTQTVYYKDGQIERVIDPLNVPTLYRYDALRRRVLVVQSYIVQGASLPENWVWRAVSTVYAWRLSAVDNTVVTHGTDEDENILVRVSYDIAGRVVSMRDPLGHLTEYTYDALGRRTKLTNPLAKEWLTAFEDVGQVAKTTLTYPGINGGSAYDVERTFDKLGRVKAIDYDSPTTTPTVTFAYDTAGNRASMTENDGTDDIRQTLYTYDAARRLEAVEFDPDGEGIETPETVSYAYDVGGLRTTLTLPGSRTVTYTYDEKGRLVKAQDWDTQLHVFSYDRADRHTSVQRPNRVISRYRHDAAGRLKQLRHYRDSKTLAQFDYTVDARGNRIRAQEAVLKPGGATLNKTFAYDDAAIDESSGWTGVSSFKVATAFGAWLKIPFVGREATLTYGTGSDHSRFDVYINGSLWQSFDGYAASPGEATATVTLTEEGVHLFEIRNRADKAAASSGYKLRFKKLDVVSADYTVNDIEYAYDKVERLLSAVFADASRSYSYQHDVAGNRTQEQTTIGITTTTSVYTHNAANQIATMQIGSNPVVNFSYDHNGNLLEDGVLTYTWNRANRLTTAYNGSYNTHYAYDGDHNRRSQTVGGTATQYLLDTEPGLAQVLAETTLGDTKRYVHSPFGVHSIEDHSGNWRYMEMDGLGSVRAEINAAGEIAASQDYAPYGLPFNVEETFTGSFAFAGEQMDAEGLSYNRARYYNPTIGVFTGLDPFEGYEDVPMSLNGYSYVHGNPVNLTDPSGENPLLGAIVGGLIGAVAAEIIAGQSYDWAKDGKCGCFRLDWANQTTREHVVTMAIILGGLSGAAFGALATIPGAGPALAKFSLWAGRLSAGMSLVDMFLNEPNLCNILEFLLAIFGIAMGKAFPGGGTANAPVDFTQGPARALTNGQIFNPGLQLAYQPVAVTGGIGAISSANTLVGQGALILQSTGGGGNPSNTSATEDLIGKTGREAFGELKFKGLVQNRPLRELTHQEIFNAFVNTFLKPSNHAIARLKDIRTYNVGMRTLNDFAKHFNKGIVVPNKDIVIVKYGRFEIAVDQRTNVIVTVMPE